MTTNGGVATGELDPRDVDAAVAEAVAGHEAWLCRWQRAVACALPPHEDVLDEAAHRHCGLGRWLARRAGARLRDDGPLRELDRAHRDMHAAACTAARRLLAAERVPEAEYDAVIDAATRFREAARRVRSAYAGPDAESEPGDELSELRFRLTMLGELERERDRALRTGVPLSLMMMRPDGMDEVERIYGRAGLDSVLASFATRLFGMLRPYDGIYRYGDNDFVICLPGTTAGQAVGIARRLLAVVAGIPVILPDETECTVGAGFGVATADARISVQETLEHAVRAAEIVHRRGGDPVVLWTPECEN